MIYPRMLKNFINGRSLAWIIIQDLGDEISCMIRDVNSLWEVVSIHSNPLVGGLHIGGLKGWLSNDKGIDDYSNGPDIDFIRMSLLSLKNFWCNIVWRTADCSLPLSIEFKLSSQTEISNLHFHFVIEEKITKLEISMDDSMTVEILYGCTKLVDIALDFQFMKTLPPSQKLIERLILTEL